MSRNIACSTLNKAPAARRGRLILTPLAMRIELELDDLRRRLGPIRGKNLSPQSVKSLLAKISS